MKYFNKVASKEQLWKNMTKSQKMKAFGKAFAQEGKEFWNESLMGEFINALKKPKGSLTKTAKKNDVLKDTAAGALAGATIGTALHPLDTLVVTKQTNPKEYQKLREELKGLKGTKKFRRLMHGSGMKALKGVLMTGGMFGAHSAYSKLLNKNDR